MTPALRLVVVWMVGALAIAVVWCVKTPSTVAVSHDVAAPVLRVQLERTSQSNRDLE